MDIIIFTGAIYQSLAGSGSWRERCGEGRNWTADAEIFSLSLYRLSYLAIYLETIFLIAFKYNFALV